MPTEKKAHLYLGIPVPVMTRPSAATADHERKKLTIKEWQNENWEEPGVYGGS